MVIKQKLIKILFSLIVSFSLSSAYAADTDIPKVDDMNKQIPKVNKNLQKKKCHLISCSNKNLSNQ